MTQYNSDDLSTHRGTYGAPAGFSWSCSASMAALTNTCGALFLTASLLSTAGAAWTKCQPREYVRTKLLHVLCVVYWLLC
jgi:hypothetical protein